MLNRTEQTFFTEKLSHLFWLQGLSPCFLTYFKIKEKVFFFSLLLNIWNKIPDPSRVENVQINIYFKTVFWHDFWRAWGCGTALPYLPTFFIAQQKESNFTMQLLFIVLAFIRQKNASWTNCGRIFRRRGSYELWVKIKCMDSIFFVTSDCLVWLHREWILWSRCYW